jgi:hypothetical protein
MPVRIADAIAGAARRKSLGDLTEFGLPAPAEGPFFRAKHRGRVPAMVDRAVIDAIRDGSVEVVATVESFDDRKVVLADGSRLDPQAVVLGTGYRGSLDPLVGHLGVLDPKARPLAVGVQPAMAGLRFVGFDLQPSFIGHMARQSTHVAKQIARELSAA